MYVECPVVNPLFVLIKKDLKVVPFILYIKHCEFSLFKTCLIFFTHALDLLVLDVRLVLPYLYIFIVLPFIYMLLGQNN